MLSLSTLMGWYVGVGDANPFVPLTVTSSPDGRIAYVACYASSTVEIVDLETLRPLTRLRHRTFGDAGAHGLAYIPRRE